MRKVVFATNMSADGCCGHTDMDPDPASYPFFTGLLEDADTLLLGRVTYQLMVPYWPEVARNPGEDGPAGRFARAFDALDKVVFSTTLPPADDPKTRVVRTDPAGTVRALREQEGKDIFVDSLSLCSQLTDAGLIDEYRIVVHPVLVGRGPRFFGTSRDGPGPRLTLVGTQAFPSGAVVLHYRRRGAVLP